MQMIYELTIKDENTSIPMQQEEVEDVYPSEENINCDAFGRLFKNPSLMPHFVVTMDHFSTGHQERKNSYHSPAVDLLCKLFSCETYM